MILPNIYAEKTHYLDNSATTRVSDKACAKAVYIMQTKFGNPSSLHSIGFEAEEELDLARLAIAESLGVSANEVIFASGGTEANNLAVLGGVCARRKLGNRVVTTSIEHSSVLEAMKYLSSVGFEVVFLKPDQNGAVAPEAFANAIDENTIFVSAMAVNNELGSFMPIGLIADLIKAKKAPALFHCDAVQAYGKVKLTPKKHGIDLMTVSSHKVHGPKGTGALYVKKGVKILPRAFGGSQELTLRPGTQGVPAICAFGAAVSEFSIEKNYLHIRKLNAYAREALADIPEITINSCPDCLPYVLNISTNAVKSETMMHFLAQRNIFVSSGSACKKGQKSYVLKEIGLPDSQIDTALRISFCKHNTIEDVDALTEGIRTGIENLAGVAVR